MKYYLIAGEASGDLHASNLMHHLKQVDANAEFRFYGGELMQQQGGTLVKHYSEMAFMGILPVIMNLKTIKRNFKLCETDLIDNKPDVLILIDYPGFNLRMAKFAKANRIKVFYYISPKIWAWKTRRVFKIKQFVDRMFTIFPFETQFYAKYDYAVDYVGNPLYDAIDSKIDFTETFDTFVTKNKLQSKPIIALLAGSRRTEIELLLPVMAAVSEHYPNHQIVVAGAPNIDISFYKNHSKNELPIVFDQTYQLLKHATAAMVASGTATLETALINTPQVVCYKFKLGLMIRILKPFVLKTKYFSLVNLIADREAVKELFQYECTTKTIKAELDKILFDNEYKKTILGEYNKIRSILGDKGASEKAAMLIFKALSSDL